MSIDISNISNLQELDEALRKLDVSKKLIQENIIQLTLKNEKVDDLMKHLDNKMPNMDLLVSDAKNLATMITFASQLAEGVSGKVRQLDLAKSRVHCCIQRVEDILDLKACTEGVKSALADEDYERAAGHVHRFSGMDENVLRMTADAGEGSTLEGSFKLLHDAQAKLQEIVTRQFDAAIQNQDAASIERFFKIFPLIGLHDEGLQRFGGFLSTLIQKKFSEYLKLSEGADPTKHHMKFADLLTQLFETVAEVLDSYQVQVETYYGPGRLFPLIRTVQSKCDYLAQEVLSRYRNQRQLIGLLHTVTRQLKKSTLASSSSSTLLALATGVTTDGTTGSSNIVGGPDAKLLDGVIQEMIAMNTRCDLYMRFLRRRAMPPEDTANSSNQLPMHTSRRIRGISTSGGGGGGVVTEAAPKDRNVSTTSKYKVVSRDEVNLFFHDCLLGRSMHELMSDFLQLEEFYLRQMILKAIQLSSTDETTLCATMVDDVFYIVKKCLLRSISSANVDCACAMINQSARVLEDTFMPALRQHMRAPVSFQSFAGQLLANWWSDGTLMANSTPISTPASTVMLGNKSKDGVDSDAAATDALRNFLIGLNSVETACHNATLLAQQLTQEIGRLYPTSSFKADSDKLQSCLSEVTEQSKKYEELLQRGFQQFTKGLLSSQVKTFLQPFTTAKFLLSDEDLNYIDSNESWVENFASAMERTSSPLKQSLTRVNYDNCVSQITNETVQRLEKLIQRKTFNFNGGRQLEKNIRSLTSYLSQNTTWSVRDKFARLSQIATILAVEKVEEVVEYYSTSTWRLTSTEIRQYLQLRNDFKPEDIRRLRL